MFEFMAIATLLFVGLIILTLFAIVGGVLKLAFKVVLIPVSLAFGLLKVILGLVAVALAIAFAPVLFLLVLLAIPLLLIAGVFGVGWAIVT